MKILVDVNVILDVVLNRAPWAGDAARLLARIESGDAAGYVAGHTITTLHYVTAKALDRPRATAAVADLLRILEVVPVEKADFLQAMMLGLNDFEDAVQAACALKVGADQIAARNPRDFAGIAIPVQPPGALLPLL